MNLGIDLGNYQVKTSKGVRFASKYRAALNVNCKTTDSIIEVNGQQLAIGKGKYDINLNKSEKDTLALFLYAVAKSTNKDCIKAIVGLPATQFTQNKDKMSAKFKGTFNVKLIENGVTINRNIHVSDVKTYIEGAGVYYSEVFPGELVGQDILIVDVGGQTANIVLFKDQDIEDFGGYRRGGLNIFQDLLSEVDPTQIFGVTVEQIDDAINNDKPLFINGEVIDLTDFLSKHVSLYVADLIKEMNKYQAMTHPILLVGGCADLIKDELMKTYKNVHFITDKDAVFANAQGFEAIAESVWG